MDYDGLDENIVEKLPKVSKKYFYLSTFIAHILMAIDYSSCYLYIPAYEYYGYHFYGVIAFILYCIGDGISMFFYTSWISRFGSQPVMIIGSFLLVLKTSTIIIIE
jgi:hypothetical protein